MGCFENQLQEPRWLKALHALPKDLGLVPRTQTAAQNRQLQGNPGPLLACVDYTWHTDTQADETQTYEVIIILLKPWKEKQPEIGSPALPPQS